MLPQTPGLEQTIQRLKIRVKYGSILVNSVAVPDPGSDPNFIGSMDLALDPESEGPQCNCVMCNKGQERNASCAKILFELKCTSYRPK